MIMAQLMIGMCPFLAQQGSGSNQFNSVGFQFFKDH
jgi:hypothetical protein